MRPAFLSVKLPSQDQQGIPQYRLSVHRPSSEESEKNLKNLAEDEPHACTILIK